MTDERQIAEIPDESDQHEAGIPGLPHESECAGDERNADAQQADSMFRAAKARSSWTTPPAKSKASAAWASGGKRKWIPRRFVKLFLDGIKQAAGLSKTGIQVFELVYHEMRANPGSDEIKLNQYVAKDHGISDRTYQRGVRELLEKEFLYRSPSDGVFFVNIRFMFNGDRLAFVKSYHLKGASRQAELPLMEVTALPGPRE